MAVFVLVHGAWHGGWCWAEVAARLADHDHQAHAPTLRGVDPPAHVDEVVELLAQVRSGPPRDTVLAGHSYAGLVVEGAADRVPDVVTRLVHLDAFVPEDGRSLFDLLPGLMRASPRSPIGRGPIPPGTTTNWPPATTRC